MDVPGAFFPVDNEDTQRFSLVLSQDYLCKAGQIGYTYFFLKDTTSVHTVFYLGKLVSPDGRTGVKSMDEDGDMGEIAKSFTHASS